MNELELAIQASLLGERNIDRPYVEPVKRVSIPAPSFYPYRKIGWWDSKGDYAQLFYLLIGFPLLVSAPFYSYYSWGTVASPQ